MDVAVLGAGQAGIAAAYQLHKAGLRGYDDASRATGSYIVLDAEVRPGGAWQHRWPTLNMESVNHIADLPGLNLADVGLSDPTLPANVVVPDYFTEFEERGDYPILRPVLVHSVARNTGTHPYSIHTSAGTWHARSIINCTGTWSRPFMPYYPGRETFRGRQIHTQDWWGPQDFRRQRVVVVGGGISATQHLAELHGVAKETLWCTRRPVEWKEGVLHDEDGTPRGLAPELGLAVEQSVRERVEAGLLPRSVVAETGLVITPSVRPLIEAGVLVAEPMFSAIVPDGVVLATGDHWPADAIIWATGFRPEIRHLAPLKLRTKQGGIRMSGTGVAGEPTVQLLGYGPTASTVGALWGARKAVRTLRRELEIPRPSRSS